MRKHGGLTAQTAVDNNRALLRGSLSKLVHVGTAYGVEYNSRPFTAGDATDLGNHVSLTRDNDMRGALLFQCSRLGARACHREWHGTDPIRQLNCRQADTTGRR